MSRKHNKNNLPITFTPKTLFNPFQKSAKKEKILSNSIAPSRPTLDALILINTLPILSSMLSNLEAAENSRLVEGDGHSDHPPSEACGLSSR